MRASSLKPREKPRNQDLRQDRWGSECWTDLTQELRGKSSERGNSQY